MTARLPVTVSSVQTWFYMYAYVKKSSPGSTQLPTSRHLLSPPTCATMTHTHTHTRINRLWSPLAYGLGGNNLPSTVSIPGPLKFMLMTLPCTMSTANSLHVQHIQLYRRRSIALKSGLNLGMANLVMQRRGSCRPTKISCLKPLLRQWKDRQLQ